METLNRCDLSLGSLVEEEVAEELVVARPEDVELLLHHRVAVLVKEAVYLEEHNMVNYFQTHN